MRNRLKENMTLIEAKQLIWDEITSKMKNRWEHITLVVEQKITIKDTEYFIRFTKEEDVKNAITIEKIISYLNENPTNELRILDVSDKRW